MDASTAELLDDEFIAAFEEGTLDHFPHRSHVRMTWIYIKRLGRHAAIERVAAGIQRLAAARGQSSLYHDTMTRAWVHMIANATIELDQHATFDQLLERHPELLDKQLVLQYYRRETIAAPEARAGWVAPDLRELPGAPPSATAAINGQEPPVAREQFLSAMRQVPTPVAIVACRAVLDIHATTITSVTSVAIDPPTVSFTAGSNSRTLAMIRAARCFSISFLAEEQAHLATRFAAADRPVGKAQLLDVPHRAGRGGAPVLTEAAAWLECDACGEHRLGDRIVVYGTVMSAGGRAAHPLIRFAGAYV